MNQMGLSSLYGSPFHMSTEDIIWIPDTDPEKGNSMFIGDLINNPEFSFDAPLRILWNRGGNETVTVFDSTVSGDIHFDLMMRRITAISMGEDGVVEIEFTN